MFFFVVGLVASWMGGASTKFHDDMQEILELWGYLKARVPPQRPLILHSFVGELW